MEDGKRLHLLGMAAAVVALAVALYLGTLGHGFVHDDHMVVEDNPVVLGDRFSDVLDAPYHAGSKVPTGLYRPLTTASLVLNHRMGGLHPRGYHALNVLLHALASAAVFALALLLGLGAGAAWIGALLFAAHPVHVEGVAYVSGRADVLSALFFLLALGAYVHGRTSERGMPWIALAAVSFFLALAAKESAAPFPLVALAWEALPGRRRRPPSAPRGRALAIVALTAPLLVYLLLRHHALGSLLLPSEAVTFVENPVVGQGLLVRWATSVAVFGRAAVLLFFPFELSPDYSYAEILPITSWRTPSFLAGSAAVLAVLFALGALARRRVLSAFLVLFSLFTYAIVSNVVFVIGTIFAERLLYLPSAGFCLLAGGALALRGRPFRHFSAILVALLLVLAAARTLSWSAVWRDNFTLFSAAVRTAPRSVKVLGNYGAGLALRGRHEEARLVFERALAIAPDSIPNRFNLAKVLFAQGDVQGAEKEIRAVLAADPKDGFAWAQLGLVLQRRNELGGAEDAFRRAQALEPKALDAGLGLAWIELEREDLDAAERELLSVAEADPGSVTAFHGLGVVELRRGRFERALAWLERAASLSPPDARLLVNVARALEGSGSAERAEAFYRRALELDPDDPEAQEGVLRLRSTR